MTQSPRQHIHNRNHHRIGTKQLGIEPLESRLVLSASMPTTNGIVEPLENYQTAANDNTFFNAAELGFIDDSTIVADNVGRRDRQDFLTFTVRRDATVELTLSGLSADADLDFYTGLRRRVDRSFVRGADNESISAVLTAGVYYVRVRSKPAIDTDYQLNIDVTLDPPPAQFELVSDYGGTKDWNLNSIYAPEVWNAGYTGAGITVAVVDSGVDWQHAELAGSIWQNPGEISGDGIDNDGNGFIDDTNGWDFVSDDSDPQDAGTHGTHVAGSIAAANNAVGSTGVAYDANIMPVRVLGTRSGSYADVARGIRYAVDNGADIINLSLGGGYNGLVYSALQHAADHDVLVVAASGNNNFARPGFPARHAMQLTNVVSVGAYDSAGAMASFSNGAIHVRDVQIDAPGKSVYSTLPSNNYGYKSGTSMATPQVAGIAALILSANPDLTAHQVRDLITAGATEYILGRRASGGVNASVSVFAATQMKGMATARTVTNNASTATIVPDDGFQHDWLTATTSASKPTVAPSASARASSDASRNVVPSSASTKASELSPLWVTSQPSAIYLPSPTSLFTSLARHGSVAARATIETGETIQDEDSIVDDQLNPVIADAIFSAWS